jgi:hypothetical protein
MPKPIQDPFNWGCFVVILAVWSIAVFLVGVRVGAVPYLNRPLPTPQKVDNSGRVCTSDRYYDVKTGARYDANVCVKQISPPRGVGKVEIAP